MKKGDKGINICKGVLWITGLMILFLFAVIWYWVVDYDTEDKTADNMTKDPLVFFEDHNANSSIDSWESSLQISEDPENVIAITGMTCACRIVNNNKFAIKEWKLRIDIVQECYLAGFWCGGVEVHQFRKGKENIYYLENSKSDVSGMNIDRYIYSENTMLHLMEGDYFVYYPSVKEKENIVMGREAVGIGFIFYFTDNIDLTKWTLDYKNDLKIIDLLLFRIALALAVIWLGCIIFYFAYCSMSKRLKSQMNSVIRSISIMADLYLEAYLIDINENTAQLIKGHSEKDIWNLDGDKVQEKIYAVLDNSCQELYLEEMKAFLDLSTAVQRMGDASSISSEFHDERIGWSAIRLFNAGTVNGKAQIVLTVQDINEEKKKLSAIEDRMSTAEYKQNVSGSFLETVSYAINSISSQVSADGRAIIEKAGLGDISELADRIVMNTKHMTLIQNTMLDLYEIECKRLELHINPYNIHETMGEVYHILKPFAEEKPYEFKFNIDEAIPQKLMGDRERLEQILVILLFSSLLMTQKGFVQFSLFGKQLGDEEELIFSIRDSAKGFTEKELNEIHEFINGASIETFDNASLVYLKTINGILNRMGSELKIVSVLNEGTDFYFTVRQKIID